VGLGLPGSDDRRWAQPGATALAARFVTKLADTRAIEPRAMPIIPIETTPPTKVRTTARTRSGSTRRALHPAQPSAVPRIMAQQGVRCTPPTPPISSRSQRLFAERMFYTIWRELRWSSARVALGGCELPWHLMQMGSYGEAVGGLQRIIKPVFESLEAGLTAAADQHARARFLRVDDPWYYLHTVRRVACERLRKDGLQATLDGSRFALPLSGILVVYAGYVVRVLHADGGDGGTRARIPVPGRSKAKQAFWRQDPFDGMNTENLLLLWQDKAGVLLEPMLLACPRAGDHRRHSLKLSWDGKLSRSMAEMRASDLNELEPDHRYQQIGDEEAG
jgi:hypothetical protein